MNSLIRSFRSVKLLHSNNLRSFNSTAIVKSKEDDQIKLTEDLPPIPPNYGFIGDENILALHKLQEIRKSFRYGNPPHLKRSWSRGPLVIRLMPIQNCSNRRFYRLALMRNNDDPKDGFIEDLGSIDPMPNRDNQILCALNLERIKYYMARGVPLKGAVGPILGLSGFLPVHPSSYLISYRNRKQLEKQSQEKKAAQEN